MWTVRSRTSWAAVGLLALAVMSTGGCRRNLPTPPDLPPTITPKITVTVTSPIFAEGAAIPAKFTCDAEMFRQR